MDNARFDRLARALADGRRTRRRLLAAALGAAGVAAIGQFDQPSAVAGRKKRCTKTFHGCSVDKKCCGKHCCFGTCGNVCCASVDEGISGACSTKYPNCCSSELIPDGGCCRAGYPVCCPSNAFYPDPYCCAPGYVCSATEDLCAPAAGTGATAARTAVMATMRQRR